MVGLGGGQSLVGVATVLAWHLQVEGVGMVIATCVCAGVGVCAW